MTFKEEYQFEYMKIDKVSINNFKVLKDFEFEPKMINLIVGKNNMGKTSILEAIDILHNRRNAIASRTKMNRLRYGQHPSELINIEAETANIKSTSNNKESALLLSKPDYITVVTEFKSEIHGLIADDYYKNVFNFSDDMWRETQRIIDIMLNENIAKELIKASIIISYENEKEVFIDFNSDEVTRIVENIADAIVKHMAEKFKLRVDKSMMIFFLQHRPSRLRFTIKRDRKEMADVLFLDRLSDIPTNRVSETTIYNIQETIKELKLIKNMERFSFDKIIIKCGKDLKLKEIAYDFLGDGLQAIINLLSVFYRDGIDNRVILINEPETGMHPAYIRQLIRFLVKFSREKKVQLFLVSHNIDFIESFFNDIGLSKDENDFLNKEFMLVRMEAIEDREILPEFSVYEDAKEAKEKLLLDLRG